MPERARGARQALAAAGDAAGAARVVADYIAGMTDRFALQTRDALRAKTLAAARIRAWPPQSPSPRAASPTASG